MGGHACMHVQVSGASDWVCTDCFTSLQRDNMESRGEDVQLSGTEATRGKVRTCGCRPDSLKGNDTRTPGADPPHAA